MARTPLIAGNWKMNLNHLEAIALTQKIAFSLPAEVTEAVEVAVLPPFVDLRSVQTLIDGDRLPLRYGAQDLSPHASGAYTGDVSGPMLAKLGCTFVVVGHSERREYHHEDDAVVHAKVVAAYACDLVPIVCVGESLEVRERDEHIAHTVAQLDAALAGLSAEQVGRAVIAYEPIWAIGTGRVATPADAQGVCGALRARLRESYGDEVADAVRVLYGGSMKPDNAAELLAQPDIDGGLVGGASLDADSFAAVCRAAAA